MLLIKESTTMLCGALRCNAWKPRWMLSEMMAQVAACCLVAVSGGTRFGGGVHRETKRNQSVFDFSPDPTTSAFHQGPRLS